MKGLADRGESSIRMVFRLQLAGNMRGRRHTEKLCFRPGKEHDSRSFVDTTGGLIGTFVPDAGYLLKEYLQKMYNSGTKTCKATRKI